MGKIRKSDFNTVFSLLSSVSKLYSYSTPNWLTWDFENLVTKELVRITTPFPLGLFSHHSGIYYVKIGAEIVEYLLGGEEE